MGVASPKPTRALASAALPKISECLRPGGSLAMFWNVTSSEDFPLRKELDQASDRHTPQLTNGQQAFNRRIRLLTEAVSNSGLFGEVVERRFAWSATYDTTRFIRLLGTFSDHQALPEEVREPFYAELARIVDGAGGTITLPYVAVLYLASRA